MRDLRVLFNDKHLMKFSCGFRKGILCIAAVATGLLVGCGGGGSSDDVPESISAGSVSLLAGSIQQAGGSDGKPGRFNAPEGVARDGAGNVYVADTGNHTVRKISPEGNVTTLAGAPGQPGRSDGTGSAARFSSPGGIAVDALGTVYVADAFNGTARKISPAGVVTTLAGTDQGLLAVDVALDGIGNLFFATPTRILKVGATGTVTTFIDNATRLNAAIVGVAADGTGNVYVAERQGIPTLGTGFVGWVRRFNSQGIEVPYGTASGGLLPGAIPVEYPTGIAADGSGNVYVACGGNVPSQIPAGSVRVCSSIKKISPTGQVHVVAGTDALGSADAPGATATFRRPQGIAVGPGGHVVVADTENHTIRQIEP